MHNYLLLPYTCRSTQVNTISFGVTGLTAFKGALTIRASFEVASDSRVNINYLSSSLVR